MKMIKKHKFTIFVIFIYIVIVIFGFILKELFFSNSGKPMYGNRLDGMDKVEIKEEVYSKLVSELKEDKNVKEISHYLNGKIINVIIEVVDSLSINDAKKVGTKVLTSFSEAELSYYDVQIFVKKNDVLQNNFPIIGYKQNNKKNLVWTKDRAVSQ